MSKKALPRHVGMIMDGNRRWAKRRGLPAFAGHKRGYDRAREVAQHAFKQGIAYMTLYAFSTENWNRSKAEVRYLMSLLKRMLTEQAQELYEQGVRLKVIGLRDGLSDDLEKSIDSAERMTGGGTKGTLAIALNYGGRADILDAVRKAVTSGKSAGRLTEASFGEYLQTKGMPDPDFIIRTSGEQRLSGFLLWQAAYSELYFTKVLWPDFTKNDFDKAIAAYTERQRRHGA